MNVLSTGSISRYRRRFSSLVALFAYFPIIPISTQNVTPEALNETTQNSQLTETQSSKQLESSLQGGCPETRPQFQPDPIFSNKLTYHKCCGRNQVFSSSVDLNSLGSINESGCVNTPAKLPWPQFYDKGSYSKVILEEPLEYNVKHGIPECDSMVVTLPIQFPLDYFISMEGEIYFPDAFNLRGLIDDYCLESVEGKEQTLYVRYCSHRATIEEACPHSECVPLCLGPGKASSDSPPGYVDYDWNVPFYNKVRPLTDCPSYQIYTGYPKCQYLPKQFTSIPLPQSQSKPKLYVQEDGKLYVEDDKSARYLKRSEYCLQLNFEAKSILAMTCFQEEEVKVKYYMNSVCIALSIFFLALTIIVLLAVPTQNGKNKRFHSINNYVNLLHCSTLLLAYSFTLLSQLTHLMPPPHWACVLIGVASNFFFVCAFFWLNVMCYDMWSCIRSFAPPLSRDYGMRLCLYCVYAFGLPSLVVGVGLLIQFIPGTEEFGLISPSYGTPSCFVSNGEKEYWLYFYGPIAVILVCNTIIFISTAVYLFRHSKNRPQATKQNKFNFWLYLRIYLVMGITWIMEVISWQVTTVYKIGSDYMWSITDTVNALQGVSIFVIFIIASKKQREELITVFKNSEIFKILRVLKSAVLNLSSSHHKEYKPSKEESSYTSRKSSNPTSILYLTTFTGSDATKLSSDTGSKDGISTINLESDKIKMTISTYT